MPRFHSFVLFAEMRTGSNFLEANLNALPGVACLGEAFNPAFIGYPGRDDLLGITLAEREADPARLVQAIRGQKGTLGGFRFFNDHDPRVLDLVLPDPGCAKIILTRNPLDSYISRLIAAATGQWKLTNARHARSEVVEFDAGEFEKHLEQLQAFQLRLLRALQVSGQTAFYLDYEDIQDLEVMNGLAGWLGVEGRLESLNRKLKKQNPAPHREKVANFDEMEASLARLDRFDLSRTPNFEPRRGPAIPAIVAAAKSPLLYLPVRGGPEAQVMAWLGALDGAPPQGGFTHKTLRQWKNRHRDDRGGHRSFTIIRHPLARAHAAFCEHILATGPGSYTAIRAALRANYALPIPEDAPPPDWPDADHRAAFAAFLVFLKANLSAQTAIRVDPAWATQTAILQGMAGFALPDHILREDEAPTALPALAAALGAPAEPWPGTGDDSQAALLARIHDAELESLARDAYGRDYMTFGFADLA